MDNKEYPKVRKAARKQGWKIEPIKSGEMFYSPDLQTKVPWHFAHSSSDPHALDGFVRELRKAGFDPAR